MQPDSKDAIVERLQFAVAELEVISGIAEWGRDSDLQAQLETLIEGVRECIIFVLKRQPAPRPPNA